MGSGEGVMGSVIDSGLEVTGKNNDSMGVVLEDEMVLWCRVWRGSKVLGGGAEVSI